MGTAVWIEKAQFRINAAAERAAVAQLKSTFPSQSVFHEMGIGRDETPFETMAASFLLKDGLAQTDDLRVRSADLDLDGAGAIDLAGPVRLDGRTAFSQESSALLVARTPQLKIRVGEDGRLTIPMKLRGTIASPRVEIDVDKLLEEGLRDHLREKKQGLLKRLLGR